MIKIKDLLKCWKNLKGLDTQGKILISIQEILKGLHTQEKEYDLYKKDFRGKKVDDPRERKS